MHCGMSCYESIRTTIDKYLMKLLELFQTTLPLTVIRDSATMFMASFNDPDGNEYRFEISQIMKIDEAHPDLWKVEFSTVAGEKRTDRLIGGRKSLPILSTIINAIQDQVAKKNIPNVYFEARTQEPSRVSLYRRIAQTFAKKNGWHYDETNVASGYYLFTVSREPLPKDFWAS